MGKYEVYFFALQRLPASIQELKKLRILDLEENHLDCLPNEIGELIHNLSQEQTHVNFSLFHRNSLAWFHNLWFQ